MAFWLFPSLQSSNDFVEIKDTTSRNSRINLRIGIDTSDLQVETGNKNILPYLCGQVYFKERLSMEGCGNGSGFLHQRNVPDTSHFRVRYTIHEHHVSDKRLGLDFGLGFVEYQLGEDELGFTFGEAIQGQMETSGPEVMCSAFGKWWVFEHSYINTDLSLGSAYVVGAPVVLQRRPFQYFGSFTIGIGF